MFQGVVEDNVITPSPKPTAYARKRPVEKLPLQGDLLQRSDEVVRKSQDYILGLQMPEGYWIGELIVDTTLVSDYVLFMHWKGEVDFSRQSKCVKHLLDRQLPDGGWNTYVGGPSELNATVKAYFSLKLAGF